jgi:hypothetical protein
MIEMLKEGCYRFTCRDCGDDVYSWGPEPDEAVCSACAWLIYITGRSSSLTTSRERAVCPVVRMN